MDILIGQTERHEFTVTNSEGAYDLTGSTATIVLRDRAGNIIYSDSINTWVTPETGVILFVIPKEDTGLFEIGNGEMQVDVVNPDEERDFSRIYPIRIIETLTDDITS